MKQHLLSAADLTYIINHAGDTVIFVDGSVWPTLAAIRDRLTTVRTIVIMHDGAPAGGAPIPADLPEYEALVAWAPSE